MKGRDRIGEDARGTIGDVQEGPIDENPEVKGETLSEKIARHLYRKGIGFGIIVIIAGIVMYLYPLMDRFIFPFINTLDQGLQVVVYGLMLIMLSIITRSLVPIIGDLLLE